MEKIVVVVETPTMMNVITLLHVYPTQRCSKNKKKLRRLRLKGFQLALSFRDICNNNFLNTKTEIVVTEGDEEGRRIAAVVREVGASTLVLGLHDRSFLYRLIAPQNNSTRNLDCKVLAIKDPTSLTSTTISLQGFSTEMDFSQIEMSVLSLPEVPPQKIPYQICPDPNAIIWRSRPTRK